MTRHLATNRKDNVTKRGLAMLLERRRKLLKCVGRARRIFAVSTRQTPLTAAAAAAFPEPTRPRRPASTRRYLKENDYENYVRVLSTVGLKDR